MPVPATFEVYPHGKLLLSAEYFVLDGALAIALPTKLGQSFRVESLEEDNLIIWKSFANDGNCWFEGKFSLFPLKILHTNSLAIAQRLLDLLTSIQNKKPGIWNNGSAFLIETRMEFPMQWGLGSSSTLVSALAQWTETDPYQLLAKTFGGSGYDLACAQAKGPIFYQKRKEQAAFVDLPFQPSFRDQLYFVYLGKKQNSREGIARYRALGGVNEDLVQQINQLSLKMANATSISDFETLIREHETLVSQCLKLERAKNLYFNNFPGEIKSLGAWGGDFVLATSPLPPAETKNYFQQKGFETILNYAELIL
ncbi:MAG: hypothetical protein DHS20C18_52770 [Saprospiraceae bacterium]|nr:MAG: hypothetical protein DHS20C18_52770 [Saprospiraceae bacterium]